jgi:hypothetical protein
MVRFVDNETRRLECVAQLKVSVVFLFLSFAAGGSNALGQATLRNFSNAVNMPPEQIARELPLGWARENFLWDSIERQKGQWNWNHTDQIVQTAHSLNMEILPMLGFTALWAASTPGKELSPPKQVEDWQNFVEHVVARYSAAPYNLHYFQVWNEPAIGAFWQGQSNVQWVDTIYLPAAKIIRGHNCKVVFGGWGLGGGLPAYNQILAHNNAWQWTDILDVHYYGDGAWQPLYDQWLKTGKCHGIWQTEIGFTPEPGFLPNLYLRSMSWALQHGWGNPYDYRVFWYIAMGGAGPNRDKCLAKVGPDNKPMLTVNGNGLAIMNQVLGAGTLTLLTGFSTVPPLSPTLAETAPTALGFRVGPSRSVVALLLDKSTRSPVRVTVPVTQKPKQVQIVTATGAKQQVEPQLQPGQLVLNVPVPQDCAGCRFQLAYVQIDE